jgi:hypothetical protein
VANVDNFCHNNNYYDGGVWCSKVGMVVDLRDR